MSQINPDCGMHRSRTHPIPCQQRLVAPTAEGFSSCKLTLLLQIGHGLQPLAKLQNRSSPTIIAPACSVHVLHHDATSKYSCRPSKRCRQLTCASAPGTLLLACAITTVTECRFSFLQVVDCVSGDCQAKVLLRIPC